jgi:AcrR family transcriptional regulator
MELYGKRGFEQTTVAEIARRAGLTERTFFRYFADKREVLFAGSARLEEFLVDAVAGAPPQADPIDAVASAVEAAGAFFQDRDYSRKRQAVIAANADLRERELIKLASLADAIAKALRRRGVAEPAARLTAEAGIAVFRIAFDRWVQEANEQSWAELIRDSLGQLRVLVGR